MRIKVWSPEHLINHADALVQTLNGLGHESILVDYRFAIDEKDLMIFFCPQVHPYGEMISMLKNYIVYNTEHAERFLTGYANRQIFRNAKQVWCHTMETAHAFREYHSDIHPWIIPPGYIDLGELKQMKTMRPHNILFVGTMNDKRRDQLDLVQRYIVNHDITIVTQPNEVFGKDLLKLYLNTKVVINLHYDEVAPLELFRIHEALSCRCHVISEKADLKNFPVDYKNIVMFTNDVWQMILWAQDLIDRQIVPIFDPKLLDNSQIVKQAIDKINDTAAT